MPNKINEMNMENVLTPYDYKMTFDEVLIKYVSENPCLFDKNDKNYKDKSFTEITWDHFALEARRKRVTVTNGVTAKHRWKTICKNFIQAREAVNNVGYYYQMLWFIPHIPNQKKKTRRKPKNQLHQQTATLDVTVRESPPPLIQFTSSPDLDKFTTTLSSTSFNSERSLQEKVNNSVMAEDKKDLDTTSQVAQPPESSKFQLVDIVDLESTTSMSTQPLTVTKSSNSSESQAASNWQKTESGKGSIGITNSLARDSKTSARLEFNPTITPLSCALPIYVDHGDLNFMNSVIFDMQKVSPKKKVLLKSKIYSMLYDEIK